GGLGLDISGIRVEFYRGKIDEFTDNFGIVVELINPQLEDKLKGYLEKNFVFIDQYDGFKGNELFYVTGRIINKIALINNIQPVYSAWNKHPKSLRRYSKYGGYIALKALDEEYVERRESSIFDGGKLSKNIKMQLQKPSLFIRQAGVGGEREFTRDGKWNLTCKDGGRDEVMRAFTPESVVRNLVESDGGQQQSKKVKGMRKTKTEKKRPPFREPTVKVTDAGEVEVDIDRDFTLETLKPTVAAVIKRMHRGERPFIISSPLVEVQREFLKKAIAEVLEKAGVKEIDFRGIAHSVKEYIDPQEVVLHRKGKKADKQVSEFVTQIVNYFRLEVLRLKKLGIKENNLIEMALRLAPASEIKKMQDCGMSIEEIKKILGQSEHEARRGFQEIVNKQKPHKKMQITPEMMEVVKRVFSLSDETEISPHFTPTVENIKEGLKREAGLVGALSDRLAKRMVLVLNEMIGAKPIISNKRYKKLAKPVIPLINEVLSIIIDRVERLTKGWQIKYTNEDIADIWKALSNVFLYDIDTEILREEKSFSKEEIGEVLVSSQPIEKIKDIEAGKVMPLIEGKRKSDDDIIKEIIKKAEYPVGKKGLKKTLRICIGILKRLPGLKDHLDKIYPLRNELEAAHTDEELEKVKGKIANLYRKYYKDGGSVIRSNKSSSISPNFKIIEKGKALFTLLLLMVLPAKFHRLQKGRGRLLTKKFWLGLNKSIPRYPVPLKIEDVVKFILSFISVTTSFAILSSSLVFGLEIFALYFGLNEIRNWLTDKLSLLTAGLSLAMLSMVKEGKDIPEIVKEKLFKEAEKESQEGIMTLPEDGGKPEYSKYIRNSREVAENKGIDSLIGVSDLNDSRKVTSQGEAIIKEPIRTNKFVSSLKILFKELPTVKYYFFLTHAGRPKGGKFEPQLSLKPNVEIIKKNLEGLDVLVELLPFDLTLAKERVNQIRREYPDKRVVFIFENVRFYPEEKSDNPQEREVFQSKLVEVTQKSSDELLYCDEAFDKEHRDKEASMELRKSIPKENRFFGPYTWEIIKELADFDEKIKKAEKILVFFGGAKFDKFSQIVKLAKRFLEKLTIVLMGALANSYLVFIGKDVGESKLPTEEKDIKKKVEKCLKNIKSAKVKVLYPKDFIVEGIEEPQTDLKGKKQIDIG
ncbi:MAG: phosphoglycerate kinase, partial [Candidatus Omnitrophota bacterium]